VPNVSLHDGDQRFLVLWEGSLRQRGALIQSGLLENSASVFESTRIRLGKQDFHAANLPSLARKRGGKVHQ
jgi:hypothetical protein